MHWRPFAVAAVVPAATVGAALLGIALLVVPVIGMSLGPPLATLPVVMASMLDLAGIVGCGLALFDLADDLRRGRPLSTSRIVAGIVMLTCVAGLLFSATRGPAVLLTAVIGIGGLCHALARRKQWPLAQVALGLGAGGWLLTPFLVRNLPWWFSAAWIGTVGGLVARLVWMRASPRDRAAVAFATLTCALLESLVAVFPNTAGQGVAAAFAAAAIMLAWGLRVQPAGTVEKRPPELDFLPSARAGWIGLVLGALALVAVIAWGRIAGWATDDMTGWLGPALLLAVGVATAIAGTRRGTTVSHWLALAGVAATCAAPFLAADQPLWLVLPAFVLPWLGLAVETPPQVRMGLVPLQYIGMVPFFTAVFGEGVPTNLLLVVGCIHLAAMWLVLPREGPWRRVLRWSGALVAVGILAADVAALAQGVTPGRVALGIFAAGFCLAMWVLGLAPSRHLQWTRLWRVA